MLAKETVKEDAARAPVAQQKKTGKKKILIATDNFLPRWDGIARFLAELIPRMRDRYDITVIAPAAEHPHTAEAKGFTLIRIPLSKLKVGDFTFAKPGNGIIRDEVSEADLVFTQTVGPIGLAAIKAAKKERKKIIAFIHSIEWELVTRAVGIDLLKTYSYALAKRFVRKVYGNADLLIVPSHSVAEIFSWNKIGPSKKIIHLGVDTTKFISPDNKEEAKTKLGFDADDIIIGYHGRLGREKDLATLLRAFILVKKNHPKAKLLVVGDGVESIKRKLARVPGVILPGSTNNVVPYLQAMDIYCLTSLTETTSLGTLEAMACGVPVIANKVGFVKEYLKPRKNGLFFLGTDSYDLARQIEFLIRDEKLRLEMGVIARKFVQKEFDWDRTAKNLEEVFESMLSSKN